MAGLFLLAGMVAMAGISCGPKESGGEAPVGAEEPAVPSRKEPAPQMGTIEETPPSLPVSPAVPGPVEIQDYLRKNLQPIGPPGGEGDGETKAEAPKN